MDSKACPIQKQNKESQIQQLKQYFNDDSYLRTLHETMLRNFNDDTLCKLLQGAPCEWVLEFARVGDSAG